MSSEETPPDPQVDALVFDVDEWAAFRLIATGLERTMSDLERMVHAFHGEYSSLPVTVTWGVDDQGNMYTGPEMVHHAPRHAGEDGDDVAEPEQLTLPEAMDLIARLRAEREDVRKELRTWRDKFGAANDEALRGARYLAALHEILGLFVVTEGAGFVRSVNVSLDDYHAWCLLARMGHNAA